MESSTQKSHGFLKCLSWKLRVFESNHPSFDDLQRLGIQVSQVATVGDELIKFDPCFFLPHPDRLLQKYPVEADPDTSRSTTPPRLNAVPTFDQVVQELQGGFYSSQEKVVQDATRDYEQYQKLQFDKNWYRQGLMIHEHIDWQLHTYRNIQPGIHCLWDFGGLRPFYPSYKKGDPQLRSGRAKGWDVKAKLRYSTRNGTFRPHMIISSVADIAVNDADQGLTTPELRAIVNMMLIRVNHRPFQDCPIHPILVLSFLGPQKGRIIQAVYDGGGLTLQHSQLWTFEDPQTAPVEMFVRYNLGQPVGLEMSTVCVR